MNNVYQYIIKNASLGTLDKQVAAKLITMLKQNCNGMDIAIIGVAGRFPKCADIMDFWDNLIKAYDGVGEIPAERKKDIDNYFRSAGGNKEEVSYLKLGYLEEIDRFDCSFFKLSPKEARLMDPEQRLFLQTVWEAFEDAGYANDKIKGSNTGVYAGHSMEFGESYKSFVRQMDPESESLSVAGNMESVIAGRISYLLDLKGPGMVVNTACSSSLAAIHLACQSLSSGECSMAVAGSVKICMTPIDRKKQGEIGTGASSQKTKTFDEAADGIGLGEGAAAVLLKPLETAIADGDHIYAIIKGSAMNQDGTSNGITAPNGEAQTEVMLEAWRRSGIHPESLSYIEVHGTGTKLGDPIEVESIGRSFANYTDKKQFCAVSAVKSNIGHLDHASGMAGMVKGILSLKYAKLPPSIHFHQPNKHIDFLNSPVYVNDRLKEWDAGHGPRRCGISSFGLSGTNCHIVLEEYHSHAVRPEKKEPCYLLVLSAKTKNGLRKLVRSYVNLFREDMDIDIADLCFTAAVGRKHYEERLACISHHKNGLSGLLNKFLLLPEDGQHSDTDGIFYGSHIVAAGSNAHEEGVISKEEKLYMTKLALDQATDWKLKEEPDKKRVMRELARLYIRGADIEFERLFEDVKANRISLPAYPFEQKRLWLKDAAVKLPKNYDFAVKTRHPLVEACLLESFDRTVFYSELNAAEFWVLKEHRVNEVYTLPGTAYLEMITFICNTYFNYNRIEFRDILFSCPLGVEENETRKVQLILIPLGNGQMEFTISSRPEGQREWLLHSRGKVADQKEMAVPQKVVIEQFRKDCVSVSINETKTRNSHIQTGPRWDLLHSLVYSEEKICAKLKMDQKYCREFDEYYLHPALMDVAVNIPINVLKAPYLPFAYGTLKIYRWLPDRVYSCIRMKETQGRDPDLLSYDLKLIDEEGRVILEALDYTLKRVAPLQPESGDSHSRKRVPEELFMQETWAETELPADQACKEDTVLIFRDGSRLSEQLSKTVKESTKEFLQVFRSREADLLPEGAYCVSAGEESYNRLMVELKGKKIDRIMYMAVDDADRGYSDFGELRETFEEEVFGLLYLIRSLSKNNYRNKMKLMVVCNYAGAVTQREELLIPVHGAFSGIVKAAGQECRHILFKMVDADQSTTPQQIMNEFEFLPNQVCTAYRDSRKYIQQLKKAGVKGASVVKRPVRDKGVYIITGGLGGIGLALVASMAAQEKAIFCFVGRSAAAENKLPELQKENRSYNRKKELLSQIKESGAKINYYSCDIGDSGRLTQVVSDIRNRYGKINGVIHCAGVPGEGFLINRSVAELNEVFSPKVYGTWLLNELTKEDGLDFFIMQSSVSSLLGGMGQCAYAGANAYMDTFAEYRTQKQGRTLSINWAPWGELGMKYDQNRDGDSFLFHSLSTAEGVLAFEHVFDWDRSNIIIGKPDLEEVEKLKAYLPLTFSDLQKEADILVNRSGGNDSDLSIIPEIDTGSAASLEKILSSIWKEALGMDEINIYTSFREMGGDSIQAGNLLKELDKHFPGVLSITDIFNYPSILEMAAYMSSLAAGRQEEEQNMGITLNGSDSVDELDQILDQLEKGEITYDEVDW